MSENLCPFCHVDNNCMAHGEESCWCIQMTVPRELLELVPGDNKRKACICLKCLHAYQENPRKFAASRRS